MATYVNNLRLKEIATGAESGTWGTSTNTNLELIADALGSGTEAITTNADTHTTTIADGAADEGRALFLKYTGTLDSACTITLAPNTVNKMWFIENATSGSQNIIISQGSGANITIASGKIAVVYTDGAGSGAAVLDALADLELSSGLSVAGATTLTGVTTHGGNVVSDTDSTDDLGTTGVRWANLYVDDVVATTTVKPGTLVLAAGSITDTSGAITFGNENLVTTGTLGAAATTISSTLAVTGDITTNGVLAVTTTTGGPGALATLTDATTAGALGLKIENSEGWATVYANGGGLELSTEDTSNAVVIASTGAVTLASTLAVTGDATYSSDVFVENGGGVVVGASAQETIDASTSEVQVLGTGDNDASIAIGRWSANTTSPKFVFCKSRNATIGSNTAVTSGDQLGAIRAVGDDGTDYDTASSSIVFDTEGTIGTGQVPGVIKFKVAAAGSLSDALTIDSAKAVTMAGDLTVSGTGPHAIGGNAQDRVAWLQRGTFTSGGSSDWASSLRLDTDLVGASGDTQFLNQMYISGSITTQTATESIAVVSSMYINEPIITDNLTGDITIAATCYIKSAPNEGETNAALYVASGATMLAGTLTVTGATTLSSTLAVTGTAYIGDTANAKATLGLTINQGPANNEILALKSSSVAHPFTSIAEADTYGCVQKISSSQGGLKLRGFREAGSTVATWIEGYSGNDSTTKNNGSVAAIVLNSVLTDGSTGGTDVGTDGNLAVIRNNDSTRFIFDAEGSAHADVEWTTF